MPISGPSSYPTTTQEFFVHWGLVNTALGVGHPMVLQGGATVDTLEEYRDDLDGLRDAVTDAGVDRTLAREELNGMIATLQVRLVAFNAWVRANLAGMAYARSLNDAFAVGEGEAAVHQGVRALTRLWTKVNAIATPPEGVTLPLLLAGGYTVAMLETDRLALVALYQALSDAEVDLRLAREMRNDHQDLIYPVLKAYRAKLPTLLPEGHALVASMPVLTPPDGHTPDAVTVSGSWNATTHQAELTWGESSDADLREYQVRGVSGDEYIGDDESLLATVPAGGARTLATDFALGTPGLTTSFKVYVVLDTGRERGSAVVVVHRPS